MLKFIRFFFVGLYVFIGSFISIILLIFRPFHPNGVWLVGRVIGYPARWILNLQVEVQGQENFDSPMSVYVSNHQHTFDIFTLGSTSPKRLVTVGKKSLLYIPFFGLMYWISGNILINRKNPKKAYETLKQIQTHMLEKSMSIWIMPEGTRSLEKGLLPFKKGPFVLAFATGRPIVPVCVSSYYKTLDFNKWNPGKVIVKVLPPIETANKTNDEIIEFKNSLHTQMKEEIERLDNQLMS